MELYDYYFQVLMANVDNLRTEELMSIHWSLIKAVELGQHMELRNKEGKFCGFLTWEIRQHARSCGNKIDLGITNLVIIKQALGTYNLMRATNYLRTKYPNVASFVWQKRKTKETIEFKQRGHYVEDMQATFQSTR